MPNWKKVILSGSNAELLSLKIPSVVAAGSVNTGPNVVTIGSDGKLHMTGSYGGGVSAGGADTQVQFNDGGSTLGGKAGFTFNKTSDVFVGGNQLRSNNAGSASDPAFGWSAQTNTGMYFTYSPNELLFTTAGVERVKIGTDTTISSGNFLVPSIHSNGSVSTGTNVVTVDSSGQLYMTGSFGGGGGITFPFTSGSAAIISRSLGDTSNSTALELIGSGSISGSGLFEVQGSTGNLFSVIDDGMDDVLFAANNISGTPVIEANADNTVKLGKLNGFGIVISGSTPAPTNIALANILMTGSVSISGSMGVGMSATTTFGRIDAKNDVVAFSTSDERLKKYVKNIPNALDKVSQINGVNFQWRKTDEEMKQNIHSFEGKDVGVIAQEVEKILPEVVITRDNGYKAVKYEKIIPLLVEAIKELQAEVQELKKYK